MFNVLHNILGIKAFAVTVLLAYMSAHAQAKDLLWTDPYVLGNPNAPVTIQEFSMFHSHCTALMHIDPKMCQNKGGKHSTTLAYWKAFCKADVCGASAEIERRFIDTGRANYEKHDIVINKREHHLLPLAVSRCTDKSMSQQVYQMILLYAPIWLKETDKVTWFSENFGLPKEELEACIASEKLAQIIEYDRQAAIQAQARSAPTFVVDEQKIIGPASTQELIQFLEKAIE